MALKQKDGIDALELSLLPNWEGQMGLRMQFQPGKRGVVMAIGWVDEVINELIALRDIMERENDKRRDRT